MLECETLSNCLAVNKTLEIEEGYISLDFSIVTNLSPPICALFFVLAMLLGLVNMGGVAM